MKQPHFDTRIREELARQILASLTSAVPDSTAQLKGSLAEGRADAYSDIDVFWEVPDAHFQESVAHITDLLAEVRSVESIRFDPYFQNSDRRRLVFVQFEELPLFWRTDIDILAQSVQGDFEYDLHNEAARGDNWSRTHSALMNAIAAVKAVLRGKQDVAEQLLVRGFERVGLTVPEGDAEEQILKLIEGIGAIDPAKSWLVRRIAALHQEVLG